MNFKKFFSKNTKLKITALAIAGFGLISGIASGVSQDEFDILVTSNKKISTELETTTQSFNSLKEEVSSIQTKKITLADELTNLELEKKAKEEKIAEEKRLEELEKERLAKIEEERKLEATSSETKSSTNTGNSNNSSTEASKSATSDSPQEPVGQMVWKTQTGKKYHSHNNCGNTNSANASKISLSSAESAGLTACSKCF